MTQRRDRAWTEAMQWVFDLERAPADTRLHRDLQQWLAADAANARAYEQARLIWDGASHLRPQSPPSSAMPSRRRFLATGGALAAGIALTWSGRGHLQNLWADYSTAVGEKRAVELADGSRLHLNTDTAVRSRFHGETQRIELMRGEAYLNVRHPLEIALGDTLVTARSGALNLRLAAPAAISVESGDVRLALAVAEQAIPAGREAVWDDQAEGWQQRPMAGRNAAAWREGRLVVSGWPVARVLDELNRYHRGTIVLADRQLGAGLVNGVYDLTRPADAVRAVAQAFGGRVREVTGSVLVVGSPV